ncbi:MAG: chemotaxis response regulator protein-glutamate methylesterase [Oligoflexales bacterium]|nr:chemotaxis response regulator protein-glutamate methylesterase [Oligoflexales bacterium]
MTEGSKKIRLLIVEDSPMMRYILTQGLSKDPEIEVISTASDPYAARDKIIEFRPDVLTLDVEMPKMDGISFLEKLMPQYPLPVVMVSSLTERGKSITLKALELGAVDFVTKPTADVHDGINMMMSELRTKIKTASTANVSHFKKPMKAPQVEEEKYSLEHCGNKIIAIGASTGGTDAIRQIITKLPKDTPGIVIVQHMPKGFTEMYARNLNEISKVEVMEGKSGDRVVPGRAVIAPGGMQMELRKTGIFYEVSIYEGDKVGGHRPSVDVLFNSVAACAGSNAVGMILTGMGCDGSGGLLKMREKGAYTIAQNAETSIIFGMPKVAIEIGACEAVWGLQDIPTNLLRYLRAKT